MAKKASRKRAPKKDIETSDEVRCVFLVGNASFSTAEAAEAFKSSNRRRTALEAHVAKALDSAPVRGRKALREGVSYLTDYMIANPEAFVSALSIGLGSAPAKDAAPVPETVPVAKKAGRGRPRAAKKAATPGAPAKRRGRPSKAKSTETPAPSPAASETNPEPVSTPAPTPIPTGSFPPPPT